MLHTLGLSSIVVVSSVLAMPKKRNTCTRCSMRRQKCDRNIPCGRCIQNGEASICTTEWPDGYDPRIHRKYPSTKADGEKESPSAQAGYPTPVVTDTTSQTSQTSPPLVSNTTGQTSATANPSPAPARGPDLEFITWGQAKLSEFNINGNFAERALDSRVLNLGNNFWQTNEDLSNDLGPLSSPAQLAEVNYLQSLIPSREQVFAMVHYHEDHLLWHHGSFHGPAFREELTKVYKDCRILQIRDLDWRWTALLFAVLAGSSLCAPDTVTYTWRLTKPEKDRLSRQWYHAIIASLIIGQYTSKYHLYTIQAIATSSLSAHVLGYSKQQLSLLSVSITIARGLSYHRIGKDAEPELDRAGQVLTPTQREAIIQRETGRRVWWHLCGQDWFCTTTTRMYSIQKRHFTTTAPLHYDDETMKPLAKGVPGITHYNNHLNKLAQLNVEFFEALQDAQNAEAEYDVVLRYDSKMRALYAEAPKFKPTSPEDGSSHQWVRWANRGVELSHNHKIIKVNQFFLGRSFSEPRYAFSRWATITASKNIIHTMEKSYGESSPCFWIEQAFMVTSCINLVLDILNRPEEDSPEIKEHLALVQAAVNTLQKFPNSAIATHGIHLLSTLSKDRGRKPDKNEQQPGGQTATNASNATPSVQVYLPNKRQKRDNRSIFQSPFSTDIALANPIPDTNGSTSAPNLLNPVQFDGNGDSLSLINQYPWYANAGDVDFGDILNTFPPQSGLEANNFFEDVFNLDFF
ncbi:uncharacterized protein BDZ99DRAFT_185521 [Mytilinidion resinicola]|uniref:Zn(2)-C6 fungal-type domain-containing protein n=1 Tax=Mytilinidion resinicola TaxID=574789 RepID=A0A6A6Z3K8_9PEZI|nr:uncharacterized protein BDZ99DRAFT_185521 [Mytilinidion resinicola]KAF2814837.1 hypothetical protein BDZ99DRAFT_185521 [Mytilinidion resinicola]